MATMRLQNESAPWVERETLVEATPEEVWAALTDEDRLEEWMAPEVELDSTVETIEEKERFAFTWSRPGEGESFVEFTLEPLPAGTRVTVVETPIGPTAIASAMWDFRLSRLHRSLRFIPVA
jgi:uncharacterized protein YndB with AHSA1/START domain